MKNSSIILLICLTLLSGLARAHNLPDAKSIIIEGVVYDQGSNELLTGALVRIAGTEYSTITDKDGHFRLEILATTTPELEISLVSFYAAKVSLEACSNQSPLTIALAEK